MNSYIELLVTLGFLAGLMWAMLRFMLRDIHNDLNDLKKSMSEIKDDMKHAHTRIDHLYETLIDLVKKKN